MATVKMTRNGKFADVFDSQESIRNAQKEGWSLVAKAEPLKVQTVGEMGGEKPVLQVGKQKR